jgi:2-oxoisovalerate dehydrogenase E2 component (dihydrolipoyl transacylase)
MSRYVFKLPDLGEGTVQAEIVGWRVKPGDVVSEDDVLVEVMTEKAAVEVPAPVSGKVVSTTGQPGDSVPVGSELVVIETVASAQPVDAVAAAPAAVNGGLTNGVAARLAPAASANGDAANGPNIADAGRRVLTSPAIRRRAKEAGIDLHQVAGSGPQGRIVRQDFEAYAAARSAGAAPRAIAGGSVGETRREEAGREAGKGAVAARSSAEAARGADSRKGTEEIKVIGLRRLIAQRMSDAKRNIPHFAYVEEVDVTELESLRRHLNTRLEPGAGALTYLPFLALALVRVLEEFPQCNAHYDAERGVIVRHRAVHLGVATQTPDGLKVPVVRDAQLRSLWDIAAEMRRVTEAARTNKATREELTGSTITLTSLGKLGGIVSTPIINAPEVAIIGVNRAVERPMVIGGAIAVRRMMNLSSSFDHRFVDGYDAAAMVQALKERLEHPATVFIA